MVEQSKYPVWKLVFQEAPYSSGLFGFPFSKYACVTHWIMCIILIWRDAWNKALSDFDVRSNSPFVCNLEGKSSNLSEVIRSFFPGPLHLFTTLNENIPISHFIVPIAIIWDSNPGSVWDVCHVNLV